MKPANIDFAPPRTAPAHLLLLLVACGACLSVALAWLSLAHDNALLAEREAAAARRSARQSGPPAPVAAAIPAEQLDAVNVIIMQLNLPWGDLRDALMQAEHPRIGLLSLEPDARKRRARLTAAASDSKAMLDYIERLRAGRGVSAVVLTHHETDEKDPNRPLHFQLDLHWGAP